MEQTAQTLNSDPVNQDVVGIVTPDPVADPRDQNFVSDVDLRDAASSVPDAKPVVPDPKVEVKVDDPKVDDETRFDKHPRFQQIIKERDDARLEAATLKGKELAKPPEPPKEIVPDIPYKDITKMTSEELREWFEEDPKGYEANRFAQFLHESTMYMSKKQEEAKKTSSIDETYKGYEKDNSDFKVMWDTGEITKYMNEHPGHNAISAHMALTNGRNLEAAVAKAKKEAEEEVTKRFIAKKKATVLTGGPAHAVIPAEDPKLQNTKQHGGSTAVLADRLRQLRQGSL